MVIKHDFQHKGCNEDYTYDDYYGCAYTTTTGLRCQTWESQEPHKHPYSLATAKQSDFKDDRGFLLPDNSFFNARPPTITTTTSAGGPMYVAAVTKAPVDATEEGVLFDPTDQILISPLIQALPLERNYCRNPDGRNAGQALKGGSNNIWCLTSLPALRWDYCRPLAVFKVPRVCLTGFLPPIVHQIANVAGADITLNVTTDHEFVRPNQTVPDIANNCSDVHPDFIGGLELDCNETNLILGYNTRHCNDTIFEPMVDVEPKNAYVMGRFSEKKTP